MSSTLHIRLLDGFHLSSGAESLTDSLSARMQSLLAYLLLHRDAPHPRQHLAFLLWPDSAEAQARTNLRRELHFLRRSLPNADDLLRVDGRSLHWRSDANFTLDVADFEAAIYQAEQARQAGDSNQRHKWLEKAALIYRGDLLPACYEDWIVPERERLSQLYSGLLEQLVELLEQRQEYARAIQYAQQLHQYDPLYEAIYRRLMRLYALNGESERALQIYQTCVDTLNSELGVKPSLATRVTFERLHNAMANAKPLSTPTAPVASEGPLVGRQTEWGRLQSAWNAAHHGAAQLCLVSGEPGIGKTRLIEELLDWAGRQGIACAGSRCHAAEGELAYAPVADWLQADAFRTTL